MGCGYRHILSAFGVAPAAQHRVQLCALLPIWSEFIAQTLTPRPPHLT